MKMRPLLIAALLLAAPAFAGTPLPDAPHVVVHGEGEITTAPDRAWVTLAALHRSHDATLAKQAVDRSIAALLAAAPEFGLRGDDITASDLSLSEDVEYDEQGRRVSNGFVANREVRVELDEIDRLGAFLDAAVAAGLTRIQDVTFESSREDALRAEARNRAVEDARAKASGLASAFDARLGTVYSINSVDSSAAHRYRGALDRIEVSGSRVPPAAYLQPTVKYSERVSAVFELVHQGRAGQ